MPSSFKTKEAPADSVVVRNGAFSIYYEKSVTKNLGNYESAKVTVGVTLPIEHTKEEIEKVQSTIELGDTLVTKELEVQLKELVEGK